MCVCVWSVFVCVCVVKISRAVIVSHLAMEALFATTVHTHTHTHTHTHIHTHIHKYIHTHTHTAQIHPTHFVLVSTRPESEFAYRTACRHQADNADSMWRSMQRIRWGGG